MNREILLLALADSVNPCTIAVMILLLAVLLGRKGKRGALLGGILFVTTIYTMYTLYGLGILSFVTTTGIYRGLRVFVPVLVLILAVWELKSYFFYRPGLVSLEMPTILRPLARKSITAIGNPLFSIPVAALCSVLLLPCSSGPYLTALFLMRGIGDLLLYNAVFVLPMVAVLLLFLLGVSPERLQEIRERHVREIHLISGILLFLVFAMILPMQMPVQGERTGHIYLVSSPTCPHCQHLKEVLREMNISYVEITPEEGRKMAEERNVKWDGGVPLLIVGNTVIEGFPSREQDTNGYFPDEEKMCKNIGSPVYNGSTYLYCKLSNGAILGNRKVLERFLVGEDNNLMPTSRDG